MELLIANHSVTGQVMPPSLVNEEASEELRYESSGKLEIVPFVIEGSIEEFDPVSRAKDLVLNIDKQWCGSYISSNEEKKFPVHLSLHKVKATGQIVSFQGQMSLENNKTKVQGNLNVKSNQMELLINSDQSISDLHPGTLFVGFQGFKTLFWTHSAHNNRGRRLELENICVD